MPFHVATDFVRYVLTAPELLFFGALYEILLPLVQWLGSVVLVSFLVGLSVPKH